MSENERFNKKLSATEVFSYLVLTGFLLFIFAKFYDIKNGNITKPQQNVISEDFVNVQIKIISLSSFCGSKYPNREKVYNRIAKNHRVRLFKEVSNPDDYLAEIWVAIARYSLLSETQPLAKECKSLRLKYS